MAVQAQARVIAVKPDEELARVLDAADSTPVIVERDGVQYRVERQTDDVWADYDPERVREGLRRSAGAFAGIDVEAFKQDLRYWRGDDDDDLDE
jgi:hypothetical protein